MDEEKYQNPTFENKEKKMQNLPLKTNNFKTEKKKIKSNKMSKTLLGIILVSLIFILLIVYIIILIYQMNLISQADIIFKTLFYTYYQKAQLLYINSVIITIQFSLVNLTDSNSLKENKEILLFFGNNLEQGFHQFYKYYMDYKLGVGENVEDLYKRRKMNKITINWVNTVIYNDYIKEMQLVLYRAFDIANTEEFSQGDIDDCEFFLLGKFKNNTNNKYKEIHGNLVKLLYYFLSNYDIVWDKFYNELTLSFEISFNHFSKKTILTYLFLEVLGILIYIIFFIINFRFLYKSNKYIFHNILCLFLDFTQNNEYNFNNRIDNILINKIIANYISLLNEFSPKKLETLQNDILNMDESILYNNLIDKSLISEIKEIENKSSISLSKGEVSPTKIRKKNSISKTLEKKKIKEKKALEGMNLSSKNMIINKEKKKAEVSNIHKLNFTNISQNTLQNQTNDKLVSKPDNSNVSENTQNISNSIINLKEINSVINYDSLLHSTKRNDNSIKKRKEDENDKVGINSEYNLTIDKILLFTKVILFRVIKLIMIIFVIFSFIFIVYYIIKIILGFLDIIKIEKMYNDFKVLCSFYNEVIHYWNNMKTLFILPNSEVATDLNNVENYFNKKNGDVLNILSTRITSYKRISKLYSYIFNSNSLNDLLEANFCGEQKKCYELINSTQNILLNGLNAAISLYGKEIDNFYRDYLKVKDIIETKEDIKKYFIKDTFTILGSNINHIISHIEEKFFRDFSKDEEEIKNDFYKEIKILNLIALFYCIALNIFSLLFVFNYVNKIISLVEASSMRIVEAICHLKYKINESSKF